MDQIAESVPGVAAIDVGRIRSGPFGRWIEMEAVSIRFTSGRMPIRIDSARISDTDYSHPVPHRMNLALDGVRLHPSHLPQRFGLLPNKVVSGQLVLRLEAVYRYRDDLQQLDLQRFLLTVVQLGELSLAGRFDNLNLERIFQAPIQPAAVFGAVTGARIQNAVLTYRDRSLVKEAVLRRARRRGQTPARYARNLVESLRLRGEGAPGGLLARTLQPLVGFLTDPDLLRISVRPKQPVTLGWLLWVRDPKHLIELLGLQIEA
jgi:hypothetical protein